MFQFTAPAAAAKYILLQRSSYQRFTRLRPYRVLSRYLPSTAYGRLVALEAGLCAARVGEMYARDMYDEYLTFRDVLPATCRSILDIGCGVAGIDIILSRHYGAGDPDVYLLDKTAIDEQLFYDFHAAGAFYNSLEVAKEMLTLNGVPAARVHLVPARESREIPIQAKIDLAVSLISWGFHYPIDMYLEQVHGLMSDGGVLVADLRRGTDGLLSLQKAFGQVDVILEKEKLQRVVARR
jgi:SAM-dependent methyltransferase